LVLELFHGPTCSFKDFGARFLAECLNDATHCKKTILVATSGDTGSAVASAFYRKINYKVIILYPEGQISAKQEQQMTCWDDNIFSFAVKGSFDQCQQLVKLAFQDPDCQSTAELSSANSINIGRLLPQMVYYAYSSLQFYQNNKLKAGFIIPSGNLGNATADYWAKAMGFPIREIVLATNSNRVISDYLNSGYYQSRPSIETLANAMDVGNPSNFERLSQLFGSFDRFKENVTAVSVNDEAIRQTIYHSYKQYHYICCPHTATAFHVRNQLDNQPWIVVATADPCKFDELIEPIINTKIPVAPQLQQLSDRPNKRLRVEASIDAIRTLLLENKA
jgi:threonine synthase